MYKIGVIGNTGYIAKSLISYLENKGFEIKRIGRSGVNDIYLDLE